jgi:hypothetical protein
MESFLASVDKVYPTNTDFSQNTNIKDSISVYNDNTSFSDSDARMYGAITYIFQDTIVVDDYAHPFDTGNFTLPIKGETVIILKINEQAFYLPYSSTPYPNYKQDYVTYHATKVEDTTEVGGSTTAKNQREQAATGGETKPPAPTNDTPSYIVKEKVKFLKPREGDTILTGRVGNTIRFSEFFLTEDGKTSSPAIFIRNGQNPELDSKKIGELVDEDINKDGTSIYITSNKVKVPFTETIKKTRIGFKDFPNSKDLSGNQLFVNSDRILLSAKASEFIIFGKGNTGIITDGNFSVDAENEIYFHNKKNVTMHSEGSNQIFLNSDSGKIYLGKNNGEGDDGAAVQKMVMGGELVKILTDLIEAITKQVYLTPAGPTPPTGPTNVADFQSIKSKLKVILSANNYLSKT